MKYISFFIYKFSSKIEKSFSKLNHLLLKETDKQYSTVNRWYREDPHSLKRSTFDFLDQDSLVFDLGGYEGQWSSDIYSRYRCKLYIFEPVQQYYELIKERFIKNPDISVFAYGLGAGDSTPQIALNKFASSVVKVSRKTSTETIVIRDFLSFIKENNVDCIHLIKINIEGSEYELLTHLISTGFIKKIKGLLIQFHNFYPDAISKMQDIKEKLALTHDPVFQYEFVWEYWFLK